MADRYQFECETCGSSTAVDKPTLGPIEADLGDYCNVVLCDDHRPAIPMERVT